MQPYNPNIIESIVEEYKNGASSCLLSTKHKIPKETILRWVKRCGVKIRGKSLSRKNINDVSEEIKNNIIKDYERLNTIKEISIKYSISKHFIKRILKNNRIALRANNIECQTVEINERYFDEIKTERQSYFLGLLYADGCVTEDGLVSIAILASDRNVIEELSSDLCPKHKIREFVPKNGNPCVGMFLRRKVLSESLIRQGCIPRKSVNLKDLPVLSDGLMFHFIRGYFDGDGCVSYRTGTKYPQVNMVGTESFIQKIVLICRSFGMKCGFYKTSSKIAWQMKIGEKNSVRIFRDKIYENATVFLKRKRNKFYDNQN